MIAIGLLLGGIIVGTGLIVAFWNEIQSWLKRVVEKLRTLIEGTLEGTKILFSRLQGVGKEISKNYSKVGMKWKETVVERSVELSEIPEEYRQKMIVESTEYEFTDELENQLSQG